MDRIPRRFSTGETSGTLQPASVEYLWSRHARIRGQPRLLFLAGRVADTTKEADQHQLRQEWMMAGGAQTRWRLHRRR